MNAQSEEMLFEEDLTFFLKKRMKKLGIGLVLLIIPPVILYFMFFYLLYWSSLFQKDTGQILIFLIPEKCQEGISDCLRKILPETKKLLVFILLSSASFSP